jgi:hypothetical protein
MGLYPESFGSGLSFFTPLESPRIPACRQTGMLRMVEIESTSSLFLPAGRQGWWDQSPDLSNGVYFLFFGFIQCLSTSKFI